ncbi:Alpha/beta hydrolase fold-1 [Aspergillus pseudocaelatus]|uniref:Alpha/beta hydrolase fold-1 n=1 Tax=Aspergillus pseudocaelatus TaxID=1825620 RepID=A0ABQ6W102_9EURO|nr:Alpha/beta hydrolase fold-1 [Aspergillus pseudocaelatus]
MSATKPVVFIVHGAWQGPHQYKSIRDALTERGFTVVQPANLSTNTDATQNDGKTPYDDAKNIQSMMEPYLAAGREIVLICHSYGGIPGSLALDGYQITDRQAKGLPGGVRRIVYLSAIALPQANMSAMDLIGQYPPGVELKGGVLGITDPAAFDDVDEDALPSLMETVALQSTASLNTPVHFVGSSASIPKTYIMCSQDKVIPPEAQAAMVQALGENTTTESIESGHIGFLIARVRPQLFDLLEKSALL